jgi:apolipoprotein N-acyltransferase
MVLTRVLPSGAGATANNGRSAPALRPVWAAVVSLVGGLAGVAAFPRFGIWWLALLSVALLSIAADGQRPRTAAWLGYLYGVAFMIPLLAWTGVYVGAFPWLLLAGFEGLFFAALGAGLAVVQRRRLAPLSIAALWVLQEALRDRLPFGGFPWGRLAFSQSTSPLRWFAALGGAPLVTFMVAVAGGGLAYAARTRSRSRTVLLRTTAAGLSVLVAVPALGAVLALPLHPGGGQAETIAMIQGNVPDIGLDFETRPRQVLDNHVAQTLKLEAEIKAGTVARPSLIVWPEDASDLDPFQDPAVYDEIDSTVRALGIPILVGAILQGPGPNHRRNAGILWSPTTGPGAQYIKRHPVPFGEYIPLRSIAEKFSSDVNLVTQDMVAGHGNGLLAGGPYPIGDVICFEVAYDSLVRSSVAAGARLLVVQTNNATFGHTAETYQQLAMSRLRAVETGRTVLQVATTGISAAIAPDGHVIARSGALYTPDVIVASVPLRTADTLSTRLGVWPEVLMSGIATLLLLLSGAGWVRGRRRPGSRTAGPSTQPTKETSTG